MSTKKLNLDDFAEVSVETLLEVKGASSVRGGGGDECAPQPTDGLWDKLGTKIVTTAGNWILKNITGIGMLLNDGGMAQNHRDGNEMAPNGMQWSEWDAAGGYETFPTNGVLGGNPPSGGGGVRAQMSDCLKERMSYRPTDGSGGTVQEYLAAR